MTKNESQIPISLLFDLLECDLSTGKMTWKSRNESHFSGSVKRSAKHTANRWNSHYSGKPAFAAADNRTGHLVGAINKIHLFAHRVVYAMHNKEWPKHSIDHINGVTSDNRINNLRDVPHKTNLRNQSKRTTNTSGITGVIFYKRDKNWQASITVDGKKIHLGYFSDIESAASARKSAEELHGFHKNHGRKKQ